MTIDIFTVAYNEEESLPDFLGHYAFARRVYLYDNESTDRTVEIARADPRVIVRTLATGGKYDEGAQMEIRNNAWRESDADYVVVCDVDEFVDCGPLEAFGSHEVAFQCQGRNMVGNDGERLADVHRWAPAGSVPSVEDRYDKLSVFSPRIAGINYDPGMHTAHPTCPIVENPRLVLRHYCHLGEEWTIRRYRRCAPRMSERNLQNGWGYQYMASEDVIRRQHRALLAASVEDS